MEKLLCIEAAFLFLLQKRTSKIYANTIALLFHPAKGKITTLLQS